MQTFSFHLQCHINAPPEPIFAMLIDHEGYRFFPGFLTSKLIREGVEHRDGVGARRAGWFKGTHVVEEVLKCEPPHRIEYRTIKCTIPLDHDRGVIELVVNGSGTDVSWVTSYGVAVPVIGDLLGRMTRASVNKSIGNILKHVKREVERTQGCLALAESNSI